MQLILTFKVFITNYFGPKDMCQVNTSLTQINTFIYGPLIFFLLSQISTDASNNYYFLSSSSDIQSSSSVNMCIPNHVPHDCQNIITSLVICYLNGAFNFTFTTSATGWLLDFKIITHKTLHPYQRDTRALIFFHQHQQLFCWHKTNNKQPAHAIFFFSLCNRVFTS